MQLPQVGHAAADRSIVVSPYTTEAATLEVHSIVIERREKKKSCKLEKNVMRK